MVTKCAAKAMVYRKAYLWFLLGFLDIFCGIYIPTGISKAHTAHSMSGPRSYNVFMSIMNYTNVSRLYNFFAISSDKCCSRCDRLVDCPHKQNCGGVMCLNYLETSLTQHSNPERRDGLAEQQLIN